MEIIENNITQNELNNQNVEIEKKQNNFLQTTLGKVINSGVDLGLKIILPDLIENQVIEVKDTLLSEGLGQGIKKAISSAVDLGKSALGIVTGNFESVSQVQSAVQKGGIIDSVSDAVDFVLNKTQKSGILPYNVTKAIKTGKNTLLNSVSNSIENEFNKEIESAEKLQKYLGNWKEYFNNKDFQGMKNEIQKIESQLKNLIPIENTLKEARIVENIHSLIENNGNNFNLSQEEIELTKMLT